MAGRGPAPKPGTPGSRIVQRPKTPDLALAGEIEAPDPPEGLLKATLAWWEAYWRSDLARAVQADTDVPGLERLAWLMDERLRVRDALRALNSPITTGSQGQPILHPLAKYIAQLDAEIRQLEDRFGLSPRARLALGIQIGQARKGLEDLYDASQGERDQGAPVIDIAGGDLTGTDGEVR